MSLMRIVGLAVLTLALATLGLTGCTETAPTPTPTPTPTPVLSFKQLPERYPYTINVPANWISRIHNVDYGTEYRFGDPETGAARIVVTAIPSQPDSGLDSETVADVTFQEVERIALAGTFELKGRTTLPTGAVRATLAFQERGICHVDAIALIQALPKYIFVVEGAACQEELDKYQALLVNAVDSFTPKAIATQ